MAELVERQFPAKALLTGLRSIGYSFSTAVADIIDNSISAEANRIDIYSDPSVPVPYFCFLDNGRGMNKSELDNAMLPGSDREGIEDSETELGRFGLGLKSASLSQCREFIVVSKKYRKMHAMSFDLDVIEKTNKLLLKELTEQEINDLPIIHKLKDYNSGTLVIWNKFDRIEDRAKNFEDSFRDAVSEAKKHTEMVFHRFYNDVEIYFNEKRIEKRDPFLLGSEPRSQIGRVTEIAVGESSITVTPHTLPFANTLTTEEKALLGNSNIHDEQGFYIYRNRRLIIWGSWLHMGIRSELNKLARVQVDIPSSLDSVWMLDVKKSSAKIPDKIKDNIRIALNDSIERSKRTTKFPGTKEQEAELRIWERINEHEGKIRYQINRTTPAIVALSDSLTESEGKLLEIILSQIETYLPKYSIINDSIDSLNIINSAQDVKEDDLISEIVEIMSKIDENKKETVFDNLFNLEVYSKLLKKKEEIRKKVL